MQTSAGNENDSDLPRPFKGRKRKNRVFRRPRVEASSVTLFAAVGLRHRIIAAENGSAAYQSFPLFNSRHRFFGYFFVCSYDGGKERA
jgi:hypothetical protein